MIKNGMFTSAKRYVDNGDGIFITFQNGQVANVILNY